MIIYILHIKVYPKPHANISQLHGSVDQSIHQTILVLIFVLLQPSVFVIQPALIQPQATLTVAVNQDSSTTQRTIRCVLVSQYVIGNLGHF